MDLPEFETTGFALLDVGKHRVTLANYLKKGGKPPKVTIEAEVVSQWGGNDGVSIEFELKIKKMKVKK